MRWKRPVRLQFAEASEDAFFVEAEEVSDAIEAPFERTEISVALPEKTICIQRTEISVALRIEEAIVFQKTEISVAVCVQETLCVKKEI